MSKRSKKKRRAKQPIPSPTAKRENLRLAVGFLATAVAISVGFWWWEFKPADIFLAANPITSERTSEFQKLKGRWQRQDGGYVLEIKSIAANGSIDAAYFNPKSIHIAKAEASRDGDATKVFIELRDVNYPGSTYSLTYDVEGDQLKGIYYQAVERQRFPVAFTRLK